MGRVNTPVLKPEEQASLEEALRKSGNHTFRMRCQSILLKAAGRKSKDVARIVGMCHVSVNGWLKRYKKEGIAGLKTKPGRGRKPVLNKETDREAVLEAVKANRQRISLAKAAWEQAEPGKAVGRDTFRNFLKVLADDISGSGKG